MAWVSKHQTLWRAVILLLLLAALIRPWAFDQINVPAEYPCTAPNIRLEGDYCGLALPGILITFWIVAGFFITVGGQNSLVAFLYSLLAVLIVLPFFSTLFFIFRKKHHRQHVIQVAVWSLAVSVGLLWGISSYPSFYWQLWGIWFYVAVAASGLALEAIALMVARVQSVGVE